jgi:hypothetical protein
LEGEVPVPKIQHLNTMFGAAPEEGGGTAQGLDFAQVVGAEDDPANAKIGLLGGKAQDCAAAADLDIVRVGTQAKDAQWFRSLRMKNEAKQTALL